MLVPLLSRIQLLGGPETTDRVRYGVRSKPLAGILLAMLYLKHLAAACLKVVTISSDF